MLTRKLLTTFAIAVGLSLMGGVAIAQNAGEAEYFNSCVACHGEHADGMGNIAQVMSVEVPDLTVLAQNNDGEFPMLYVIQVIDGRTGIRGHGSDLPAWAGGMPIWGDRYEAEADEQVGGYATELMVRGRILALAQYVESLQK